MTDVNMLSESEKSKWRFWRHGTASKSFLIFLHRQIRIVHGQRYVAVSNLFLSGLEAISHCRLQCHHPVNDKRTLRERGVPACQGHCRVVRGENRESVSVRRRLCLIIEVFLGMGGNLKGPGNTSIEQNSKRAGFWMTSIHPSNIVRVSLRNVRLSHVMSITDTEVRPDSEVSWGRL